MPAGRYGEGRRTPRWAYAVAAALAVCLVAGLVALARALSDPAVTAGVRSFATAARSVRVTFEVNKDPGATAVCVVRARNRRGAEVGREEVRIGPAAGRQQVITYELPTTDRPISGEVRDCRLSG